MSTSRIERIRILEPPELETLVQRSLEEGFGFVQRLRDEYASGKNCFDQPGEALFLARDTGRAIAVVGLNRDPYGQADVLRLRRFYVLPEHRRQGLGRRLLHHALEVAQDAHVRAIELRTNSPVAAQFYEHHGFEAINTEYTSHRLEFSG